MASDKKKFLESIKEIQLKDNEPIFIKGSCKARDMQRNLFDRLEIRRLD